MSWLSILSEPAPAGGGGILETLVQAHRDRTARLERGTMRRRQRTTRQIHRIKELEQEVEDLKSFVAGLTRLMIEKGTFEAGEVNQLVELVDERIAKREQSPVTSRDGVEATKRSA